MKYANILPDEKLFSKTAPPYASGIVNSGNYEVCVLAAVDEDRLKGYGVFSHMKGSAGDIWLEYLYTCPRFREKGIASGLLEYAEGYMRRRKAAGLFCKMYVKYSEARESASYLIKRGYLPLSRDGRLLAYRHGDMVDAGLFDLVQRNRKKLPPSVKVSGVSDKSIKLLLSEKAATGFSFDRGTLQNSLSLESNLRDVGGEFEILVEGYSKRSHDQLYGRTSQYKTVIIPREGHHIGELVRVRILSASSATLIGEVV